MAEESSKFPLFGILKIHEIFELIFDILLSFLIFGNLFLSQ